MPAELIPTNDARLAAVEGDQFDSYIKLVAVEGSQYQLAARSLAELIRNQADPAVICAFGAAFQAEFHPEPEEWDADSSL